MGGSEHAPHNNSSKRAILNTQNPSAIQIVHRGVISEKYMRLLTLLGVCAPCSCLLCTKEEVFQSTYVQVHENRVEWNYPGITCHPLKCCRLVDNVQVLYFDRKHAQNSGKAGPCFPMFTHCSLFPDCCGICGETLILYSTGKCGGLCCRTWIALPGLEDAQAISDAIHSAKAPHGNSMSK
mmetsp:Transcript_16726/g.23259  ORF Transcript_16726/g.23259 Transcript_16726/m.23259 type:complete len:181 (+) Transcript_16726:87-629(+)|eukprot:CAMPEP_0168556522 /NCGR_PEP_ID=MMETSP0413-20121227/8926_1 /TAXON_ID=136452 /ORGANISM="Filamoeba nolandi, Strain NC-AS-23-1" /LENGTH=180 /DNA_ID=CAMNT_0008587471 /DNA_START=100 /DNA_END=642 /DNA_ORIENTATION=-